MQLIDFDYELPPERIAHYPLKNRSESRLLVVKREHKSFEHRHFHALIEYLEPGDLLVFNDSRVFPARLYGHKPTGGKVEILIERILNETEVLAHVKASHIKPGQQIEIAPGHSFQVLEHTQFYHLRLESDWSLMEVLKKWGHIPLPPYIKRPDEALDTERYQTVYAQQEGSVAAPTAGLHFDKPLLATLQQKGIRFAYVTLHVGAGTFQPVKVTNILEHKMHYEWIELPQATVEAIYETKQAGKRVIAVGTTVTRTLESVAQQGELTPYFGETDVFIYPGFHYKVVDGLITNFHLPKSSLLMLVSAFMGLALMHEAYAVAIDLQYRFFSYGDAMLIL